MGRKLIFFDIDGTLVDGLNGHDYLTDYTKQALKKLKEDGHYIFIASGRPYPYLLKEILEEEFDGYILSDGAHIIFKGKEIGYHPLNQEDVERIIEQAPLATLCCYEKDKTYLFHDDGSFVEFAKYFNFDQTSIKTIKNYKEKTSVITKLHLMFKTLDEFNQVKIDEKKFYCAQDEKHLLKEIYSRSYSKATALKEILDYTGLKKEDTYFFGDGLNDLEMMDAIGHGIAMGNACEILKEKADYICKDVSEDGVADFIFHSGLF